MLNKKSVDDLQVKGKRVLVRCDYNVPLKDGVITDENRMFDEIIRHNSRTSTDTLKER